MLIGALMTLVGMLVQLAGEKNGDQRLVWAGKPVAATGFLVAAWGVGAAAHPYGQAVLVALALSWLGDMLLIPRDSRLTFTGGLFAFLLGHLGFAVAFLIRGASLLWAGVAAAGLALVAVLVGRWLLPHAPSRLKGPVVAYIVVISTMVALAVGTCAVHFDARILVAATCFFVSDLAVARHRFVHPSFANKVWGLPLYFGAQLVFAWTAAL